ncbi:ankyrin repeat domain-containing protein [Kamptonema cortianum]|nr:ankyrin repeat domain-containing protein [Geitlerinema splendidum]MDK3158647.1 ankyrin repeat domain-containing protein [Kamptonema cortianum]
MRVVHLPAQPVLSGALAAYAKMLTAMNPVVDCILLNDADRLRQILADVDKAGSWINEVQSDGYTPLFIAVMQPQPSLEIVRLLLEAGADIHAEYVAPKFEDFDLDLDESDFSGLGAEFEGITDVLKSVQEIGGDDHREAIFPYALKSGNLDLVKVFVENGADIHAVDSHGYTALHHAASSSLKSIDIIRYLVDQGVDPNAATTWGETPLKLAIDSAEIAELLLEAGADDSPLKWSALHRLAAFGTEEEIIEALSSPSKECLKCLNQQDALRRTPIQYALRRGMVAVAEQMIQLGAEVQPRNDQWESCLDSAIRGGNQEAVRLVIQHGFPINWKDSCSESALHVAAFEGNAEMIRLLLELGAEADPDDSYNSPLNHARSQEAVRALLDAGLNPAHMDHEAKRRILGLGDVNLGFLAHVSEEEYRSSAYVRAGTDNPEDMSDTFRLAMIRAGCSAYQPRLRFKDDAFSGCSLPGKSRPAPVWCFDRFGQTITFLSDGRTILIGGEHEDFYDPDFCIYNDVVVFQPGGDIKVYGYPKEVFEPTDFHTDTLIGDCIYVIGGLGYHDQRKGPIPVYRVSTQDYSIQKMITKGKVPPRIYRHSASLQNGEIHISGGESIHFFLGKENHKPNSATYSLDISTLSWRVVNP